MKDVVSDEFGIGEELRFESSKFSAEGRFEVGVYSALQSAHPNSATCPAK